MRLRRRGRILARREQAASGASAWPGAGTQTLFEKLAAETGPLQGEREPTVNAVEAGARRIVWAYHWQLLASEGLAKRCIVDDGVGMRGGEAEPC